MLAVALTAGGSHDALLGASFGALAPRGRTPDLALHAAARARAAAGLAGVATRTTSTERPVCSGDVCEPAVALPGEEPRFDRATRTDLFLALVSRAGIEPLASVVWAFASTGLQVEYRPSWDGADGSGRGWGSVLVRLRFRLDADNRPVFAARPRG